MKEPHREVQKIWTVFYYGNSISMIFLGNASSHAPFSSPHTPFLMLKLPAIKFDEDKECLSKAHQVFLFKDLVMYVTTYALRLIKSEHDLLKRKHDNHEDIGPCTHEFKKPMGLPC